MSRLQYAVSILCSMRWILEDHKWGYVLHPLRSLCFLSISIAIILYIVP